MNDFSMIMSMVIEDAIFSGIAALGFAMLFNVPRRALIYCVIAGAVGHAIRTLMMEQFGLSIIASTLIGATTVGFLAKGFAYRLHIPSLVFGISGAIPMVPGVFAFETMRAMIALPFATEENVVALLSQMAVSASTTGFVLAAIALGIAMPNLLFLRRKPVV
jgi:uncharacterized membrane protein YjjB (DUF3815 family)